MLVYSVYLRRCFFRLKYYWLGNINIIGVTIVTVGLRLLGTTQRDTLKTFPPLSLLRRCSSIKLYGRSWKSRLLTLALFIEGRKYFWIVLVTKSCLHQNKQFLGFGLKAKYHDICKAGKSMHLPEDSPCLQWGR